MDERNPDPADVVEETPTETPAPPETSTPPVTSVSPGPSPPLDRTAPAAAEAAQAAEPSPAWARFTSCRWHHAAEGGVPAHCTHRDVFPLAGLHGFSPESWCPDCPFYKLRRTVRRPQTY